VQIIVNLLQAIYLTRFDNPGPQDRLLTDEEQDALARRKLVIEVEGPSVQAHIEE
jgi:hypothetical protein